jgi:hypothetical protein
MGMATTIVEIMKKIQQRMAIIRPDQMIDRTTDFVVINHLIRLMIVIETMIGITITEIDLLVGTIMIV